MTTMHISTVRGVVDALGGTGATADFLNIVPSAVSNMLRDDHIPRGYHLQIFLELQRRGYHVDLSLFGLRQMAAVEASDSIAAA